MLSRGGLTLYTSKLKLGFIFCRYSEMLVTGKMTLAVAKICEACAESHKTGKKVVISWADEEIPEGYVKI